METSGISLNVAGIVQKARQYDSGSSAPISSVLRSPAEAGSNTAAQREFERVRIQVHLDVNPVIFQVPQVVAE